MSKINALIYLDFCARNRAIKKGLKNHLKEINFSSYMNEFVSPFSYHIEPSTVEIVNFILNIFIVFKLN
jgi:hypothetical protein